MPSQHCQMNLVFKAEQLSHKCDKTPCHCLYRNGASTTSGTTAAEMIASLQFSYQTDVVETPSE